MKKLISMLLALTLLLCACGQERQQETYPVYYRVTDQEQLGGGDILQACEVQILGGSRMEDEALALALLEKLFSKYTPLGCRSPVEVEVDVLDLVMGDGQVTIWMDEAYASLTGLKRSLADYAVTLTLCRLEGVEQVALYCGEQLRLLTAEEVLLSMESQMEEIPVELYYLDRSGDLVAADHLLLVPEGGSVSLLLLQALAQPPAAGEQLQTLLQEDYHILSADLQGESCYINLDRETVQMIKRSQLEHETYLAMEMSLRSLENIKSVIFMNEGSVIYRNEDRFPLA